MMPGVVRFCMTDRCFRSVVIYQLNKVQYQAMRKLSGSSRAVLIAIAAFVIFFGATNWFRQVNLMTSQFDMGNMDQALWHSLHGQWFQMANPVTGEGVQSRAAAHADFLLLAYLPFYAVWPDPRVPLVLQIVAVASGAIPLFWWARKKLGPPIGAFVAVLYLTYPTLEWGMTFDVHAVVLTAPLFLWAWWAMAEKRWWLYGLMAGLALLGKEEVGLVVAAMGLYWVWRTGYRRAAVASTLIGLTWSVLMVAWAIPLARQAPGHFALGFYSDLGDSYSSILRNVVLHPLFVLRGIFDGQAPELLRALFVPLALLPIIGLPVLLVAIPEFAINLLSNNPNQQTIFFQYMSVIVPFMFLAMVDGWARLRRWLERYRGRWSPAWLRPLSTGLIVICAVFGVWYWSPIPWTKHSTEAFNAFRPSPYRDDVRKIQALLKPTDRVATTNNLGPQFSRRNMIWVFPNNLARADVVVVLERVNTNTALQAEISNAVDSLSKDPNWTVVYRRDLIWALRRIGS